MFLRWEWGLGPAADLAIRRPGYKRRIAAI